TRLRPRRGAFVRPPATLGAAMVVCPVAHRGAQEGQQRHAAPAPVAARHRMRDRVGRRVLVAEQALREPQQARMIGRDCQPGIAIDAHHGVHTGRNRGVSAICRIYADSRCAGRPRPAARYIPRPERAGMPEPKVKGRSVAASKVEMTEIVLPTDGNALGNVMGGRIMHWIDICAAVSAGRHARTPVVTASVDKIDFVNPVPVGAVVVLLASCNFTGRTSMEIGVKVWQEDRVTGVRKHIASAYLTFVSLDPDTR